MYVLSNLQTNHECFVLVCLIFTGDLTSRININSHDEVGELVDGINLFIEKLQEIMKRIRSHSENILVSSKEIAYKINESGNNTNEVSATMDELPQQCRKYLQLLKN